MSLINQMSQTSSQVTQTKNQPNTVSTNNTKTSTNSTGNPFLDGLRLPSNSAVPEAKSQQLTQEDFFSLLSQQLSMQDPFKPVDRKSVV